MKSRKLFYLFFILVMSIAIISCDDATDPEEETPTKGSISVSSSPSGAQIWLANTNTNKVTPAVLTDLEPGQYVVKLVLDGYRDTSVVATNVTAGQEYKLTINLTSNASLKSFSNIMVWESNDPSSEHPSGIDLSDGKALSISGNPSNTDKAFVDIFYSSDPLDPENPQAGYIMASSSLASYMTRDTYFYIGSSTNINDHVAAPVYSSSNSNWKNSIPISTKNYIFLYDEDGHYSKFRIVAEGSDPNAYAQVEWIYNNTKDDSRF